MDVSDTLQTKLEAHLEGEVRFDLMSRRAYAVDASIYEVEPVGVVVPRHRQDLHHAVQLATAEKVPLIARGAATGITGGCIGSGLILDTAQHMNRILEINLEEEWVRCEPGLVQDRLNDALAPDGYRLGPDTSTGNRATIGGMIGNNAAGSRSLRYGKMVDHVLEVELALANGDLVRFGEVTPEVAAQKREQDDIEGEIYRAVEEIQQQYANEIRARFPDIPRRVSGYNLDELIKDQPLNLAKLVVGSEGSLGIVTEVKVRIAPRPVKTALVVFQIAELVDGLGHVSRLLEFHPLALELIDDQIIKMGRVSPALKGKLDWLRGDPGALFVLELDAPTQEELDDKVSTVLQHAAAEEIGYAREVLQGPEEMNQVWTLRKSGLGLLLSRRTYSKAIAFVEDITVDPSKLQSFIGRFKELLAEHGKEAGIYGHLGSGCIHIRPYIDLRRAEELEVMTTLMNETADLLLEHEGALSGEHGDGFLRSWTNKKMFGPKIYEAFCKLKEAFDPTGLMNPGKVVATTQFLDSLRIDPTVKQREIATQFAFKEEGGFAFALEMCNGNAACRKKEGTMCPSFQASGDERHSTRARAQALRGVINGKIPLSEFTSSGMHEILDLCIECKGCKKECPSQVNMAKLKAEFLYHYHQEHGISLRDRLFGHIGFFSQLAAPVAPIANWISSSSPARALFKRLGITTKRSLPPFAGQRFSTWARANLSLTDKKRVVLFSDTFTEFNTPEVGIAAAKVLRKLGYDIVVPPWTCCGRTLISKGLLPEAKRKATKLVDLLYPLAREGLPIIGLEPSCILTLKDEVGDLTTGPHRRLVVDAAITFDEFVAQHLEENQVDLPEREQAYQLHGHCHQKAIVGLDPTLQVIDALPGATVDPIESGCCGMAGSFGYEAEHYDFSLQIGELALLPAIRSAPDSTGIIANGFSCRSQIAHGTGRSAHHLAEVVAKWCS